MNFRTYRFLTAFFDLVISAAFALRSKWRREPKGFRKQRLGQTLHSRPNHDLIWVHGASIGEIVSAIPIIDILKERENTTVLVTSGTVSAAEALPRRLPSGVIHQSLPIDTPQKVKKFLSHWRPSAIIFIESEIWPNYIYYARKDGINIAILNARLSSDSYRRWKLFPSFAIEIFSSIKLCIAQDSESSARFRDLGVKYCLSLGNLKLFSPRLVRDDVALQRLVDLIQQRKVWLASSTHEGEEELIARVHNALKREFSDILTIIVPRHTSRSSEIASRLSKNGKVSIRSRQDKIDEHTDFYLADTFGELGTFYSLCKVVFIGATLVPKGGHNPMEAACCGCAIIHGPFTEKNREMYNKLEGMHACVKVNTSSELEATLNKLFTDQDVVDDLGKNAARCASEGEEILNETVRTLRGEFLHDTNTFEDAFEVRELETSDWSKPFGLDHGARKN